MKTLKRIVSGMMLMAMVGGGGYAVWWWNDGVSHREICNTVKEESGVVQSHIDKRCDILGAQCDIIDTRCGMIDLRGRAMDEKLDRIEAKLDALLKLASEPVLQDGLQPIAD